MRKERICMKTKSKKSKKTASSRNASLRRVLSQNEKIKETVEQAASELTLVNEVLKQGKEVEVPIEIIKEILTQNKEVEYKVAQAADDLHQVNAELVKEMAERAVIESELSDMKSDLADMRDDLAESQAKEEETRKSALQDALTGLPNRLLFEQGLEAGLIQAKRHGWGVAVLFIDLDEFKSINDTYGHDMGDKVLLRVAERLTSSVREQDMVSRWGGDEFVCLLLEVHREADVIRLAEHMVQRISEAGEINGTLLSIRASIGIAIYPATGETSEALFKNADTAMYKAKGTQNRVVLYRDSPK